MLEPLRRELWSDDKQVRSGRRSPAQRDADVLAYALAGITLTDTDTAAVDRLHARAHKHGHMTDEPSGDEGLTVARQPSPSRRTTPPPTTAPNAAPPDATGPLPTASPRRVPANTAAPAATQTLASMPPTGPSAATTNPRPSHMKDRTHTTPPPCASPGAGTPRGGCRQRRSAS